MKKSAILKSFSDISLQQYKLPLFTVYNSPKDFEGKFVVRLFNVDQPTEYSVVKDTLEEIREALPKRLARLERSPGDDPVIVEIWV